MNKFIKLLFLFLPERISRYTVKGRYGKYLLNVSVRKGFYLRILAENDSFTVFEMSKKYLNELITSAPFANVEIIEKRSLLFPYKRRYGVIVGGAVFFFLMLYLSSVLWCINVSGISRLDDSDVRTLLKDCGVYEGVAIRSIDNDEIRIKMMSMSSDIAWMSVNVSGTRANVQIVEAERKPETVEGHAYSNIVASRDGVVTEITVARGVQLVFPGDTVREGEVLVSGIIEERDGDITYTNAIASVIARTERVITADVPLEYEKTTYGSKKLLGLNVKILGKSINISLKYRLNDEEYDIIHKRGRVALFNGFELPVEYSGEYFTPIYSDTVAITKEQAAEYGRASVHKILLEQTRGSVVAKRITCEMSDNSVKVTMHAVCDEEIAIGMPFTVTP